MNEYQNIRLNAYTARELRDVRDTLRVAVRLRPDAYPDYMKVGVVCLDKTVQYLIQSAVERLPTFFPITVPASGQEPTEEEVHEAPAAARKPRKRK